MNRPADDEIDRLMKAEGLDFITAVERLAAERGYVKPKIEAVVIPFPKPGRLRPK